MIRSLKSAFAIYNANYSLFRRPRWEMHNEPRQLHSIRYAYSLFNEAKCARRSIFFDIYVKINNCSGWLMDTCSLYPLDGGLKCINVWRSCSAKSHVQSNWVGNNKYSELASSLFADYPWLRKLRTDLRVFESLCVLHFAFKRNTYLDGGG